MHEMYLLGAQKCLRHGRDMVALDYEAKEHRSGVVWGAGLSSPAVEGLICSMTGKSRRS
jgi:hypothetical protein